MCDYFICYASDIKMPVREWYGSALVSAQHRHTRVRALAHVHFASEIRCRNNIYTSSVRYTNTWLTPIHIKYRNRLTPTKVCRLTRKRTGAEAAAREKWSGRRGRGGGGGREQKDAFVETHKYYNIHIYHFDDWAKCLKSVYGCKADNIMYILHYLRPMCLAVGFFALARSFHSGLASISVRARVCVCVRVWKNYHYYIYHTGFFCRCAGCASRLIIVFIYLNMVVVVGVAVCSVCMCFLRSLLFSRLPPSLLSCSR